MINYWKGFVFYPGWRQGLRTMPRLKEDWCDAHAFGYCIDRPD